MQTFSRNASAVITLAAALVLMPSNAAAQNAVEQDPEPEPEACTAAIRPAQIVVGSAATRVTIALSESIGAVTGVQKSTETKSITVTAAGDMPRIGMPASAEGLEAIAKGANDSTWTVWLNTSEAAEGVQMLTFVAGENSCVGELEVVPAN